MSTPVNPPSGSRGLSQPARERAVTLLTAIGTLMVAVDSTIVILALPTMARDLASPLSTIIWTILIYLLITAALTTQAGKIGDLLGRGRVYNLGFAIFTVGSALSGFAPTDIFLIVARGIQAVGGALVFANGGALIAAVYPPERRGRAFGFLAFGWGVGAILGVLLGGVITTDIGWRYIFFINIPIGIFAAYLGLRSLPKDTPQKVGFDLPGFVLFSAILSLVCYGLIELAVYGVSILNVSYLVLGGLLLVPWITLELRSRQPMLNLHQLKNRLLAFSLVAGLFQSLGYLSVVFLLTMYLQGLRGLSPLDASLLLVPGYLIGALLAPVMGRSVDQRGARTFATLGILCMGAAVLGYSLLDLSSWLGFIPMISLVSGIGTGMFYPANTTAIMSQATPSTFGAISGVRTTLMNLGTLLSFVLALTIASASIPRAVAYEVFLGTTNLVGGLSSAFLTGIHAALWGSAAILLVAALLSWSRGREVSKVAPAVISTTAPAEPAPLADGK
ncbi:MAG TPA: MFS transporter [Thermoplasmata archaeon]|nr:MFS transporter [Thermoplasmata archaeon]